MYINSLRAVTAVRALRQGILAVCVTSAQPLPASETGLVLQDSVAVRLIDATGLTSVTTAGFGMGATRAAFAPFAEAAGLVADSRGESEAEWNLTRPAIAFAVARLRTALAAAPDFAAAHYLLGLMDARQRRYGDALAGYRRAAGAGPPFSGDPMKALFLEAVARCQAAAQDVARGTQYLDRGKVEDAGTAYRRAVALMPDYAEAHANLGLVRMLTGDLDGAVSRQMEAIRLAPDLAEAHYNLGSAYSRQGRYAQAVSSFREAIRLKPENAPSDSVVSAVDANQGAYTRSVAGYQHARRYAGLAGACFNLGDTEAAIEAYGHAVRLAPDFADGHYNLGVIHEREGNAERAMVHWRAYLKLARNDPAQKAWLADARARLNRLENSREK
ncbi:MAG: tetratricopeptide repeat protein [Gemmatimonadota bacterium]|nr:tetratricopeptide repeat protein [Gemmatimonadota bacterium]